MAYFSTEPVSERRNPTGKNRVWDFFRLSNETHPANRLQPAQPRRKIRPTPMKTASGIPLWPSRDPIGEKGGLNLYGFVGNDGVDRFDLLGQDVGKSNSTNGKFNVNMTVVNGPARWGLKGTIEFIPDPKVCPKCENIKIIQIVKITDLDGPNKGKAHKGIYEAKLSLIKTLANENLGIEAGYFVDHTPDKVQFHSGARPFCRDYQPKDSKDGSNDGSNPTGSSIWDGPGGGEMVQQNFETCAVCADNGARTILGCVKWGYTMTGEQPNPNTVALPSTSSDDSSPTFSAALAIFDTAYRKPN